MKPFIAFVTGVSGAGKTTIYRMLRQDPQLAAGVEFHDIDEDGVPSVGRGPWRQFRVELLLYQAIQRQAAGISTVICGITFPHEVIWSEYFDDGLSVRFILLDTSPELISARLTERIISPEFTGEFDECFNPNNRDKVIAENQKLRLRLLRAVRCLNMGHIVDGHTKTVDEMYNEVVAHLFGGHQ